MLRWVVRPLLRTTQGHIYLVVSGDVDPGDPHPVLRCRTESAADSGQRSGQADRAGERVYVIGSGKTAMDACIWLLAACRRRRSAGSGRGTPGSLTGRFSSRSSSSPGSSRGCRSPLKRRYRPRTSTICSAARGRGQLVRLDPAVEPTMYRCATVASRTRQPTANRERRSPRPGGAYCG